MFCPKCDAGAAAGHQAGTCRRPDHKDSDTWMSFHEASLPPVSVVSSYSSSLWMSMKQLALSLSFLSH